jgi:hypothetical protein
MCGFTLCKHRPKEVLIMATNEVIIPSRILAEDSPRSLGGVSMFEAQYRINSATVGNFFSDQEVVTRAAARLQDAGFEILQVTPLTINIAGTAETYQRAFATTIIVIVQGVVRSGDRGRQAIALVLNLFRRLPNRPMSGTLPSGAISPAIPPDSWYTRGALLGETRP